MSYTSTHAQVTGNTTVFAIGATPTPIFEILDFSQSGKTLKTVTVTNLNSTSEEILPTMIQSGSYEVTMNRVSTDPGQILVKASFDSKALTAFTITLPILTTTGDKYTFSGYVTEFEDLSSVTPEKQLISKWKVQVTGLETFVPGT